MLNNREIRTCEGILVSEKLDSDKHMKEWLLIIFFLKSKSILTKHVQSIRKKKIREFPQDRKSYCF